MSEYWNQGFATEAATAVKEFATSKANIDSKHICSFIRRHNKASIRVSEKIGMQSLIEFERYDIKYFLYGFSGKFFQYTQLPEKLHPAIQSIDLNSALDQRF